MEKLLKDLLEENGIHVHSVKSRVKSESSIRKNIVEKRKEYSKLEDAHDFSGIRIITFFADEVDLVAGIINKEFVVDEELSVDKRKLLDPDRFGYLSLHYVVHLSPSRLKLTEYQRFKECQSEIQIRSILQHAWAEIEHDLGYKSKKAVPKEIQRRFSRIAGLLEIADSEFTDIRIELREYEESVPELISTKPEEVTINKASLISFINTSSEIKYLDQKILTIMKVDILKEKTDYGINFDMQLLEYLGIKSIKDIDTALIKNKKNIEKFAEEWISEKDETEKSGKSITEKGISLFYLAYVLIAKTKSINEILNYVTNFKIGAKSTNKFRSKLSKQILETYKKAIQH